MYLLIYKLQRTCNLMVQIEWCWFHSKILILWPLLFISRGFLDKDYTLVSFKNIDIWLKYGQKMVRMSIFGHTFFGHNSAISGPIGLYIIVFEEYWLVYILIKNQYSIDGVRLCFLKNYLIEGRKQYVVFSNFTYGQL